MEFAFSIETAQILTTCIIAICLAVIIRFPHTRLGMVSTIFMFVAVYVLREYLEVGMKENAEFTLKKIFTW